MTGSPSTSRLPVDQTYLRRPRREAVQDLGSTSPSTKSRRARRTSRARACRCRARRRGSARTGRC